MRLVLLLLIIFGVLVYFAGQELYTHPLPYHLNPGTKIKEVKEAFESPTRASDCRCLPGYIPSKVKGTSGLNGEVFTDASPTFWYFFVPSGSTNMYRIQEGNPCGIPHIYTNPTVANQNKGNYPRIPNNRNLVSAGVLKCDIMNKNTTVENAYFCQNLDDSQKTKACY